MRCTYKIWLFMIISLYRTGIYPVRFHSIVYIDLNEVKKLCVLKIEQMFLKCLNLLGNFYYTSGSVAFNDQRWNLTPLVKSVVDYVLVEKGDLKIRTGHLIFAACLVSNSWQNWLNVLDTWTLLYASCGVNNKIIQQTFEYLWIMKMKEN